MRYVVVRLTAASTPFQAISNERLRELGVHRGPIRHLELLDDGSMVQLRSVEAGLDAYRDCLASTDACYSHVVSGAETGLAYCHFEPTDAARRALEWEASSPVAVEMPIEFDGDEPVLTIVGAESQFRDALESLPSSVEYTVVRTGRRSPEATGIYGILTSRQREVLSAAVECGYYRNPREATQEEVAANLDISPGTAGDHLRKIESRVFAEFASD